MNHSSSIQFHQPLPATGQAILQCSAESSGRESVPCALRPAPSSTTWHLSDIATVTSARKCLSTSPLRFSWAPAPQPLVHCSVGSVSAQGLSTSAAVTQYQNVCQALLTSPARMNSGPPGPVASAIFLRAAGKECAKLCFHSHVVCENMGKMNPTSSLNIIF